MSRILNFLFPDKAYTASESWFLLALRILFGLLLMSHGIAKWSNFAAMSETFPDPLHVGSHLSLSLAVFAEVLCAAGFVVGAFYRLALIPMIFTMSIAFFVIHANDPFAARELAFVYLVVFVLMYITGPGRYALDTLVVKMRKK